MTDKPTSISITKALLPAQTAPNIVQHVDSKSSEDDHVDADAAIMTTQIGMLMQLWPSLTTLGEMCQLSDQLMKTLHRRRELCLRPTNKSEINQNDKEIDITPI